MTRQARPVVAFIPPSCCGAGYFNRLRRILRDRIDLRLVELPGHGRRYREIALTQARLAVPDIVARIGGPVDAVYGESLGAYLGLAVVSAQPANPILFAASNSPPSVRRPAGTGDVPSFEAAVAELREAGGEIPPAVLADPGLAAGAYPLIRDDLLLGRSLADAMSRTVVSADIHVLAGRDDTGLAHLGSWADHTRGRCVVTRLPGGHLLSATNPSGVAAVVLRTLASQ